MLTLGAFSTSLLKESAGVLLLGAVVVHVEQVPVVRSYRERYSSQQIVEFLKCPVNGEGLLLDGSPSRLCAAERPT